MSADSISCAARTDVSSLAPSGSPKLGERCDRGEAEVDASGADSCGVSPSRLMDHHRRVVDAEDAPGGRPTFSGVLAATLAGEPLERAHPY